MGSSFHQAAAGALAAVRAAAGVAVTVRRGAKSFAAVAAVGKTPFRQDLAAEERRLAQRVESRDYLVAAAAYDFGDGAGPVEPAAGDTVEETLSGVTFLYEVAPFFGEPPARWADPGRTTWRVHTQAVDQAAAT